MIRSDKTENCLREEMHMKKESIKKKLGLTAAFITTVMILNRCGTQVVTQTSEMSAPAQMDVETVEARQISVEKIEAGKEHEINDRCLVLETYDVYNVEASQDLIVSECLKDTYEEVSLVSHTVEEVQDGFEDRVMIEAIPVNPTGMLMQTISFEAVFVSDKTGEKWSLKETNRTDWTVESPNLPGSTWKLANGDIKAAKDILGNESLSDDGNIYLRFKGNVGYISPTKKESDTSIDEANIITNGSGTLIYLNGDTREETVFKLSEGSIKDNGELILTLTSDKGSAQLNFGDGFVTMSIKEIDSAFPEEKPYSHTVYIEDIPALTLTSDNIENGTWEQKIGAKYEDCSPQLKWDPVEGAGFYTILMIDEDDRNHVHWYTTVDRTTMEYGDCSSLEEGYIGPYPPRAHNYTVYVFAVHERPDTADILLDVEGKDIHNRLNEINSASDSFEDNVISVGSIRGSYKWYTIY